MENNWNLSEKKKQIKSCQDAIRALKIELESYKQELRKLKEGK